jgi:hypothetical protein
LGKAFLTLEKIMAQLTTIKFGSTRNALIALLATNLDAERYCCMQNQDRTWQLSSCAPMPALILASHRKELRAAARAAAKAALGIKAL